MEAIRMIKSYEDFDVYQRAYKASLAVHRKSLELPKTEQYELASQLRRSTKSICANIAEGHGRRSTAAEFKRFLAMALGSTNETRVHLRYCKDLGYLSEDDCEHFDSEYVGIGKMLSKLIQIWK